MEEDQLKPPTYRVDAPVICDLCYGRFTTGVVGLEDGNIVWSRCAPCDRKARLEDA
jgi:hypothetical protein